MSDHDALDFDRRHIWHPYTSPTHPLPVYQVVSAEGVRLRLADGRELLDGMSSWWCAIHGYNHPVLNEALRQQTCRMAHVMFGGLTHPPAIELARRLVALTPGPLEKVFFCDSGSVAVEVAIKMAIQYWGAQQQSEKSRLLTIRHGYHGDTFAAMAVSDPVTGMHHRFAGLLAEHFFAEAPKSRSDAEWCDTDMVSFRNLFAECHQQIAAVILEPIVQGAGGMRFYAPEFLRQVRTLCNHYGVLLIADEIATGFGRTGRLFACEHAGISPDIMCLGKAITGGYLSFAATLTTEKVSRVIGRDGGVFMHGPTFMANPLACAVANASIDLLLQDDWQANICRIEAGLCRGLESCRELPGVADVRVMGAIGVVELTQEVELAAIQAQFVDRGVWIRPFGRLVYTMPPYIISDEEIAFLTQQMMAVVMGLAKGE
ncbi:MAG: adenosylmethionine--8-amino-7-oxononanoate transaminase [Desulfobulbaceae bacterium]|nr:adenosylmethionine--8-amino-7-oxononanoate transaminase [Desulfobulbaceae bacterium]